MSGNAHVRCEAGENPEINSKDYLSLFPKIESAEMMFSASRSRRVSIVPIIQSLAQLEKNYGKEGAEIIVDNTQLTVFGGFAPNSETAQVLSKSMGTRTVMSGSVSQSKNDPSRSLQMIERPLMTADELKSLPKGTFVVTKTGFHPIKVRLKLVDTASGGGLTREDVNGSDLIIGPVSYNEMLTALTLCDNGKVLVSPLDPKTAKLAETSGIIQAPSSWTSQIDELVEWVQEETGKDEEPCC